VLRSTETANPLKITSLNQSGETSPRHAGFYRVVILAGDLPANLRQIPTGGDDGAQMMAKKPGQYPYKSQYRIQASPMRTPTMKSGGTAKLGRRPLLVAMISAIVFTQATLALAQQRPRAVDLLPERTSIYVQIEDVKQLVTNYQQSNFGRMLADERIAPLITELYGEAKSAYEDIKGEVGVDLDALASLPTGEICFAMITPRREKFSFVLFMDVSEEAGTATALLARMHELVANEGGKVEPVERQGLETFHVRGNDDEEVFYILHEDTFVAATNEAEFDEILGRWLGTSEAKDKTLADNRKFTTIMNQCKSVSGQPQSFTIFVDPITLARSTIQGATAPIVFGALRVLGLDGVNAVGGSAIFNEKDYESVFHGHLLLSSPREGVFQMIALKPGVYDPEPFVPENCSNYITSYWDAQKFMTELEKIVDTFTSEGTFQQQLQENINDEVGIDLQTDLIDNLAGRITLLTWNNTQKAINAQSTILSVEVADVEKGTALVEKLMAKASEANAELFATDKYEGVSFWKLAQTVQDQRQLRRARRQAEREGLDPADVTLDDIAEDEGLQVEIRPTQPCMGFIDNYFVVTDSPECLKYLIDTANGKNPRMVDDEKFRDTMKDMERLLETRLPSVTMYSRPDVALRSFYELVDAENTRQLLAKGAEDNKYLRGLKRVLDENPLPPFDELVHYFPPQGGFVVNDETGFHFLAFQRRAEEK
jgi:hypothetical protein